MTFNAWLWCVVAVLGLVVYLAAAWWQDRIIEEIERDADEQARINAMTRVWERARR